MEIILKKDVANLGHADDVVKVKTGYAVNYLIPQGFATLATPSALKQHQETLRQRAHKEAKKVADAEALAAKVSSMLIKVAVKVSESGKIYGSVTTAQLAEALAAAGAEVDKKDITILAEEVKELGGTNQVDAIEYLYSLYDSGVHPVDVAPKLREHTDDYIYFRTDHHWTALGAYYGYEAFCEEKGIDAEDRDDMEYLNMGDFLGSFYSQLSSAAMAANPDYVEAWVPNGTNEMRLWDEDGIVSDDYNVITDTSEWDITGKTMAFIMGDQALQRIDNPAIDDGSACLLIKDSYGDFLAPWLVDHYQTVYVGDFRYFQGNIDDFVRENDIDDLIFCNNVSLAGGGVAGPAILGRL